MAVELTEAQINGRFQLLERPLAAPGKCAVCGSVDKPVLDFGFDLDFYGVVYICVEDFKAGAQILGLVDVSQLVQPSPSDEVRKLIDEYLLNVGVASESLRHRLSIIDWSGPTTAGQEPDDVQDFVGPELSDDSDAEPIDSDTSEQDSEPIVSEGPAELSASSDDGSEPTLFKFDL